MIQFSDYVWWCPECRKRRRVRWSAQQNERVVRCCGRKFKVTTGLQEKIIHETVIMDVEEA